MLRGTKGGAVYAGCHRSVPFPMILPRSMPRSTILRIGLLLVLTAAIDIAGAGCSSAGTSTRALPDTTDAHRFRLAANYSARRAGDAVLIASSDSLLFEEYQNGYNGSQPHMLASGSKTFSGLLAWAAQADGYLSLDDPVARYLPTWSDDPRRADVTIRELLHLTAGLPGGIGAAPSFAEAARTEPVTTPGTGFHYGPTAFQVFGAVLEVVLEGEDPTAYLQRRILDPIGATARWRRVDGDANLAGGARMTARDWLAVGQLILNDGLRGDSQVLPPGLVDVLRTPLPESPGYGLTVWLNAPVDPSDAFLDHAPPSLRGHPDGGMIDPSGPPDLFMAAGLFNQRLYVLPSQDLVVVRLGRADRSWDDAAFLGRLLRGDTDGEPAAVERPDASAERIIRLATDRQMARLDSALALTETQEEAIRPAVRGQIRAFLDLRSERERRSPLSRRDKRALYRRAIQIQRDAQTAIEEELRPDQREAYRAFVEQERERRRETRDGTS